MVSDEEKQGHAGDFIPTEKGFTKQNVRAITAIGESTKSALLSNGHEQIGEKGVGFKSVFGIARSVEIHSNGFDFKLTDELPTVPQILKVEAAKNDKIDTVEDRSTPAEEQKAEGSGRFCSCCGRRGFS